MEASKDFLRNRSSRENNISKTAYAKMSKRPQKMQYRTSNKKTAMLNDGSIFCRRPSSKAIKRAVIERPLRLADTALVSPKRIP